jgi:hypothetical protein
MRTWIDFSGKFTTLNTSISYTLPQSTASSVTDQKMNNYQQIYIYNRPSIIMQLLYTITSDVLPDEGPTGSETRRSGTFLNMLQRTCNNEEHLLDNIKEVETLYFDT